MSTQFVDRVAVEIDGAGDAVLMIHGLGGTSNFWTPVLPALSRFRTIRPDLPGSGRSHRVEGPLRGWSSVHVTDGEHPYMGKWWVPGLSVGYGEGFTHQAADFLEGLRKKKSAAPTFRDALETNRVCDAIIASGKSGRWVKL